MATAATRNSRLPLLTFTPPPRHLLELLTWVSLTTATRMARLMVRNSKEKIRSFDVISGWSPSTYRLRKRGKRRKTRRRASCSGRRTRRRKTRSRAAPPWEFARLLSARFHPPTQRPPARLAVEWDCGEGIRR